MLPTLLIAFIVIVFVLSSYAKHRDTFHPAMILGPMLAFHYCYSPWVLFTTGGFLGFLSDDMVTRAQWVHLAGVLALCLGVVFGAPRAVALPNSSEGFGDIFDQKTLFRGSLLLAAAGIASFASGIGNVGGFAQAYGTAYGGGWNESGWVRDLVLLCLPALMLFALSQRNQRVTLGAVLIAIVYASPFLIHGFFGARRGPTFMAFAGMVIAFYMIRGKRPRLLTLALGGGSLCILMLILVANRTAIYLGSEEKLDTKASQYLQPTSATADFVYSAGLVIVTEELQNFSWGTTYLTTLFVRPIPRAIWPDKYIDAARFFDRPSLEMNLGVDVETFRSVLGWTAPLGSAPGIVGDMWREFSWGMLLFLAGIGWFHGYAWRRAVAEGRSWLPVYCYLASLSVFLVMQTLEAIISRFLFGVVPMLWILHQAARKNVVGANRVPMDRTITTPRLNHQSP